MLAERHCMSLGDDEFVDRGLQLVVEEALLLDLGVVAKHEVCLTIEYLAGKLGIAIEVHLPG